MNSEQIKWNLLFALHVAFHYDFERKIKNKKKEEKREIVYSCFLVQCFDFKFTEDFTRRQLKEKAH